MRKPLTILAVCLLSSMAWAGENDVAIDVLVKQLKSDDSDMRRDAAKRLGEFKAVARKAGPALIAAVKTDKDLFVRRFAAQSLGEIGADPKAAVAALSPLLKEEKELMEAAIGSLGKMGSAAVPALVDALKKKDGTAKKERGNKKGPMAPDRMAFLRAKAAQALGRLGAEAKTAVPALIDALKDTTIRVDVVAALGDIGPAAKAAVPALRESIGAKGAKKDKAFSQSVNQAIRKIEKN